MSRDNGFTLADIDTGLYADAKVRRLARLLRDPRETAVHVALYEALLLGSWADGERVTLEDAAPAWWLDPVDDIAANLEKVHLIDAEGRIPEHAWESFYLPAWERRERRRHSGKLGGQLSSAQRRSSGATSGAQALLERSSSDAEAALNLTVPTVPTVDKKVPSPLSTRAKAAKEPSDRRLTAEANESWSTFGPEWDEFRAAWIGRGLYFAPYGDPGEEGTQRSVFWELLEARPADTVRWVTEAPPGSSAVGIGLYCLRQWHDVKGTIADGLERLAESMSEAGPTKDEAAATLAEIAASL